MWSNSKCYNDDRNQCTRQHKAGDRGDELPWRTISSVFTGTYAHIARVCVCVCVNGSILRLPISFYFQCKSAQSAGLSADPPAQVVFSLDTHTLPQEAKPDCWILAIFHVNGVGRCLFFFFFFLPYCWIFFGPFILGTKVTCCVSIQGLQPSKASQPLLNETV